MFIVGLTGGIASGKSTVAEEFHQLGVPILDTDQIAKALTEVEAPAYQDIVVHFGKQILRPDASLDRKQLQQIIFQDTHERIWLESLLHPLILRQLQQETEKLSTRYCIWVIPLLIEKNLNSIIDRILVVDVPEALQIERLQKRDHLEIPLIQAILKTQATRTERLAAAHDILDNSGSQETLKGAVLALHQQYMSK